MATLTQPTPTTSIIKYDLSNSYGCSSVVPVANFKRKVAEYMGHMSELDATLRAVEDFSNIATSYVAQQGARVVQVKMTWDERENGYCFEVKVMKDRKIKNLEGFPFESCK